MRTIVRLSLASLLAAGALAAPAAAQDDPTCREVRPGLVRCTETNVHGRQPAGWVLLGRSRVRWEPPALERRDARGAVVRSVRRAPF
ncbi:MAG TPA: hypothetical protein RMH99_00135 [Sandaracinaceae bacterium LLY-WYZ-13_1]|nr:hypothetical protein [Sandaracinaceae bacterium LLY-WYZ-13_1]